MYKMKKKKKIPPPPQVKEVGYLEIDFFYVF